MKTNIIFFITLILCSSTLSTHFQSKESSMEYIINELVELNIEAGAPSEKIQELLNGIENQAKVTKTAAGKTFGGIGETCKKGNQKLKEFIQLLRGDILSDKSEVNKAEKRQKKLAKDIKSLKKQLKEASEGLSHVVERFHKENTNYRKFKLEARLKLDVLKRLRDLINDELINGSKAGAFIQVDKFKDTVNELQEKMNNVEDSSLFTPLVSSLVSLTESGNFSDQTILKKILVLIARINKNIVVFLRKHDKDHKEIVGLLRKEKAIKYKEYGEVRKMLVQAENDNRFEGLTIKRASNNANLVVKKQLERKQREQGHWSQLCASEDDIADNINKNIHKFLSAITTVRKQIAEAD